MQEEKFEIPHKYLLCGLTILCFLFILISMLFENSFVFFRVITDKTIAPMQKGITNVCDFVQEKIDVLQEMQDLKNENVTLKQQVEQLNLENKIYMEEQLELERLRDLYKLDSQYPEYQKVGARVIGTSSMNWFGNFVIDKGSKDGIAVDMNVICGNGLVGIVTDVGPDTAVVRSIIDDSSNVSAIFLSSDKLCIVQGDAKSIADGYIKVLNIPKEVEVNEGDAVLTSSISDKFLPGITIGYVEEISIDSNHLTKSAKLYPAVDFENIHEVLVITQLKQSGE